MTMVPPESDVVEGITIVDVAEKAIVIPTSEKAISNPIVIVIINPTNPSSAKANEGSQT
jgi:hypothetical protein